MLKQPVWYKDFEGWLLRYGAWGVTIALVLIIALCCYWLWQVWVKHKPVGAATFAAYMWMP